MNATFAIVLAVAISELAIVLGQSSTDATLPVTYSAKVMNGSGPVCPPRDQTDGARAEIREEVRTLLQNSVIPQLALDATCKTVSCFGPPCRCGFAGRWRQLAFLNMSDPNQECPPQWRSYTSPARSCGRITGGVNCDSVTYTSSSEEYSRICGMIKGYRHRTPDGFGPHGPDRRTISIDNPYMDGVSVTRGSPRQHIWSFAAAFICPCTSPDNININIPSYVGENYYCEYGDDNNPLWDGEGCSEANACECSFNSPPWFCLELEEATTDDIEVRICGDQPLGDEDNPVELIEIYVQ